MSRQNLRHRALMYDARYFPVEASALIRIVESETNRDPELALAIEVFVETQEHSVLAFLAQVVIGDRCWLAVCQGLLVEITYLLVIRRSGGSLPTGGRELELAIETEIAHGVRQTRAEFEAVEAGLACLRTEPGREGRLRRPYGAEVIVRLVETALQRVLSGLA